MTSFSDLHLELEIKAKDFGENPTDENGDKIIAEIVHLIENNASILVDGIPSDVNPNVIVPSGYYANDGRFYIHIFSSKVSFDAWWFFIKPYTKKWIYFNHKRRY